MGMRTLVLESCSEKPSEAIGLQPLLCSVLAAPLPSIPSPGQWFADYELSPDFSHGEAAGVCMSSVYRLSNRLLPWTRSHALSIHTQRVLLC